MFFKTDKSEIVEAYAKYNSDKAELHKCAEAFAKEYGAKPIVLSSHDGAEFGGIVFEHTANINHEIWRKPSRQYFNVSHLRVKPTKKIFQEEFDAEKKKYDDLLEKHFPNGKKVDFNLVIEKMGIGSGDLFFSGFACFPLNGVFYIKANIEKLKVNLTEILGSEFQEAYAQFNKEKTNEHHCRRKLPNNPKRNDHRNRNSR
mgnify:CR=1 FL=1